MAVPFTYIEHIYFILNVCTFRNIQISFMFDLITFRSDTFHNVCYGSASGVNGMELSISKPRNNRNEQQRSNAPFRLISKKNKNERSSIMSASFPFFYQKIFRL